MTSFQYRSDILDAYPNLSGGVIVARGVRNGPTPPDLLAAYQAEQAATLARIGETPLSELPSLAGWRAAFRSFGVDPTQYRSAAEALLRRLTKKGDIPSINTLVDLGNLISIRYGLPVAIVDTRALALPITVHFSDGAEPFRNLNQEEVDHPTPGEVIFTDENKVVVARRWCWRQSDESGARDDTTDIVVTCEAQHPGGARDVSQAVAELAALLRQHAGAEVTSALLGRDRPGF